MTTGCVNCKHGLAPENEEPCRSCTGHPTPSKWEPENDAELFAQPEVDE